MNFSNLISTRISKETIDEINDLIVQINEKLPGLITLTPEQRDALPQVGEDTFPFVFDVLKKAKENPELAPPAIDLEEIEKDAELIKAIKEIMTPLKQLVKKLEDSELLAGSEAYVPSLFLHNAMKNASKGEGDNSTIFGRHHRNLLRSEYPQRSEVKTTA